MAAVDPGGSETFYFEGKTTEGVRNQQCPQGQEYFWINGISEQDLFPKNNGDTGKFFLLFE
jgi:hypothetical protein